MTAMLASSTEPSTCYLVNSNIEGRSISEPRTRTKYTYDTLNRLNGLANSWAGSFGFGYDALSRRTSLTRPNGVNTSYSYDGLSHLLSVLHQAGLNTLDGASYTYDLAGNRLSKTNYLSGVTSSYSYDSIYELTRVTQGASTTETYSYDAAGNRLSSLSVPNYNYNVSNELTSNSNGSYTYDSDGNELSDPSGRTYTWDFENRLIQAVVPGTNGGTTTFKYDPFGRRIQKSGPLGTTNYLYDGSNDAEEVDNSGNVLARYIGRQERDQPLAELHSGAASYYEADGLGSVTSLSNASGSLAETYVYDSFGKLTASTGTLTNPFQYTARDFDSETGLNYYRARYYDQNTGRFTSEDPLGFHGGFNFYRYVKNSPTNYVDPYGLATCYLWFQNGYGTMYCVPDDPNVLPLAIPVASGNNVGGQCKNNQACQKISGQGPIPQGWWEWTGPSQSHASSGGRNLEPMPGTDVLDFDGNPRNGILSHSCAYPFGPSTNPTNICSKGCVTSTVEDIELLNSLIDAEPNSKVFVYGPGEGGPFN